MLDSSPVALPPIPRPLKRSASTASLPTPPPTHRKCTKGQSNGSCDTDSDEDVGLTTDDELVGERHKKRRLGEAQAAPLPLLYKRRQAQIPVSPPPSRRTAVATPKVFVTREPQPCIATGSPPVTPKTRSSTRRILRDSPDNPFLATPEKSVEDTPSPSGTSANPSPLQERPTIAYVLYFFFLSIMYLY